MKKGEVDYPRGNDVEKDPYRVTIHRNFKFTEDETKNIDLV